MVRWLDSWTVRIVGKSESWNGWTVGMVRQAEWSESQKVRKTDSRKVGKAERQIVGKSERWTVGKTNSRKVGLVEKSEWVESWNGLTVGKSDSWKVQMV